MSKPDPFTAKLPERICARCYSSDHFIDSCPVTVHELKTTPEHFENVRKGIKPFELRLNDRDFKVGDWLKLREYQPLLIDGYTGEELEVRVTTILPVDAVIPCTVDSTSAHNTQSYVVLGLDCTEQCCITSCEERYRFGAISRPLCDYHWREAMSAGPGNLEEDDYDFGRSAQDIADERGLVVVYPEDNQLQLDLDTEEAHTEFLRRYSAMSWAGSRKPVRSPEVKPSDSGLPHRHVTITFPAGVRLDEWERMAYQAALGDDPIRHYLNVKRKLHGEEMVCRLFERPDLQCPACLHVLHATQAKLGQECPECEAESLIAYARPEVTDARKSPEAEQEDPGVIF